MSKIVPLESRDIGSRFTEQTIRELQNLTVDFSLALGTALRSPDANVQLKAAGIFLDFFKAIINHVQFREALQREGVTVDAAEVVKELIKK